MLHCGFPCNWVGLFPQCLVSKSATAASLEASFIRFCDRYVPFDLEGADREGRVRDRYVPPPPSREWAKEPRDRYVPRGESPPQPPDSRPLRPPSWGGWRPLSATAASPLMGHWRPLSATATSPSQRPNSLGRPGPLAHVVGRMICRVTLSPSCDHASSKGQPAPRTSSAAASSLARKSRRRLYPPPARSCSASRRYVRGL